jgi:2-oxoglutarate dehydrogenase E2 component (dihydrolipoamide succinyltransferase)
MATPVKLPELGESVTEGTVTRWLKQVGDSVEVDEPLLEVSTDKVDTEIPSPVAGTLLEIRVEEDETVEVGAELAIVGDSDEAVSADSGSGGDDKSAEDAEAEPAGEGSGDLAEAAVTAAPHADGDRGGQAGGDDAPVPACTRRERH